MDGDKETNRLTRQVLRLLHDDGFVVEIRQDDHHVDATATRGGEVFKLRVSVGEHDAPRYTAVCRLAVECGINLME